MLTFHGHYVHQNSVVLKYFPILTVVQSWCFCVCVCVCECARFLLFCHW